MNTYQYDNFHHSSVWYLQHYIESVNPRSSIRNTQQHKKVLLEIASIYTTLLNYSCCKNFFAMRPMQQEKTHTLKLYLVYQNGGFIEEYSEQTQNSPVLVQDIKSFIEHKMHDESWFLEDRKYHLYEQVIHQGSTAIHIFGLYQKTYSGSYCFFLLDCIVENKKEDKELRTYKLRRNKKYCNKKYKQYLTYLQDNKNKGTLEAFCRENNFSSKKIYSRFKRYYGCSFKQFLLQQQLLTALFLIIYSRKSLKEIAHEVGFEDYSNFQKAFKRCGITPSHIKRIYF